MTTSDTRHGGPMKRDVGRPPHRSWSGLVPSHAPFMVAMTQTVPPPPVLLELWNSTGGARWRQGSRWFREDVARWEGVICVALPFRA